MPGPGRSHLHRAVEKREIVRSYASCREEIRKYTYVFQCPFPYQIIITVKFVLFGQFLYNFMGINALLQVTKKGSSCLTYAG